MNLKKALACCLACVVLGSTAYSEEAFTTTMVKGRSVISGWRYASGDSPGRPAGNFNDSSWQPVSPPAPLRTENGYLWLRTTFPTLPPVSEGPVHVMLGRMDTACEVYLNGSLIGTRGHFGNPLAGTGYSTAANSPGSILIPRELLAGGGNDILALRLYAPTSSIDIPLLELGDTTA
jgi:hypothetical protein